MKTIFCLLAPMVFLSVSCDKDRDMDGVTNLNCEEYWSQVAFSNFCGLSRMNFDYNTIPEDICNADQNDSYAFDEVVSIRVFNHFSVGSANEEYTAEKEDASAQTGYMQLSNVGDDAYGIIETEFGELNGAEILVVKGTFTIGLFVNGNAAIGANNCFDESSVVEFARALADPL